MKKVECCSCYKYPLSKDEIGINQKLMDSDIENFFCISCLAEYLECSVEELLDKIEEFKEQGCTLFS